MKSKKSIKKYNAGGPNNDTIPSRLGSTLSGYYANAANALAKDIADRTQRKRNEEYMRSLSLPSNNYFNSIISKPTPTQTKPLTTQKKGGSVGKKKK